MNSLGNKKLSLAAWQMLPSPQVTVALGSLGFDWVVLDFEHASLTTQEAETLFIATERCGCKPFARLPSANPYLARRLLDAGAVGLIVPVVEERDQYDLFAEHCFFPPIGKRGLGLVRSNLWGDNLESYFSEFKPIMIAQIESVTGAKNISSLINSKFLSGIMIGPYDLSASLNKPGQFTDQEFLNFVQKIRDAVKNSGKLIGYHQVQPDLKELEKRTKEGYDFIAYGTDIVALRYAFQGLKGNTL